ncbi:MAG: MopE-related protein [bacterium]
MATRTHRGIRLFLALLLPSLAAGCNEPDESGTVADAARDASRGRQDMFQPPPDMQPFDRAVVPPPRDAAVPDAGETDVAVPDMTPPPVDMAVPPPDMAPPPPADMGAPDMGCAAREVCHNGIDDDCNGIIDDPLVCDQERPPCVADAPCFTGQVGICADGTSRCPNGPDGEAVCDPLEEAAAEVCDGERDEDCDGNVDEGFGLGEGCEAGVGACRAVGLFECAPDGGARCNAVPRGARLERCDGNLLDKDCDGTVDEGFEDLGQPCQVGLGICEAAGEVICAANGVSTRCSARPAGPGSELCNQADDDCDGNIDEVFDGLGEPCVLGLGACRAEGTRVCFSENRTYCNAQPGVPDVETCNATDDDCDGVTDEGPDHQPLTVACYGGPDGTAGVGLCRQGRRACGAEGLGACVGEVGPAVEVCDGSDNDCDGRVDEGADGNPIREACYAGPDGTAGVGACRAGNRTCRNGALSLCEGQVRPRVEICDSLDNDCNGQIDDVAAGGCDCVPLVRRACYSGPDGTQGVGRCRAGNQNCRADGTGYTECFDEFTPSPEACNGEDDDCDGRVDEEIDGIGAACNVGLGRAARSACSSAIRPAARAAASTPPSPTPRRAMASTTTATARRTSSSGWVSCVGWASAPASARARSCVVPMAAPPSARCSRPARGGALRQHRQ